MEPGRKQPEQGQEVQLPKARTPRLANDMSDPEIDLKQGEEDNKELEKRNPKFKAMVDRLRQAARAVGHNMKMFLTLA